MNTIKAGLAALAIILLASGGALANGGGADRDDNAYTGVAKTRAQQVRPAPPARTAREDKGAVQKSSTRDKSPGLFEWLFGGGEDSAGSR